MPHDGAGIRQTPFVPRIARVVAEGLSHHVTERAIARSFSEGESLFRVGDANSSLFVVTEGEVEIVEHSTGQARQVAVCRKDRSKC